MKNRSDIRDFIIDVEQKFPVNDWEIGGICIWPYLRYELFFYLIHQIESQFEEKKIVKDQENFKKNKNKVKLRLTQFRKVISFLWYKKSLKSKKYIYVGAHAHRVDHKDKMYNRFFDPLIEKKGIKKDSYIFDIDYNKNINYYNKILVKGFVEAFEGYVLYSRIFNSLKKESEEVVKLFNFDLFLSFLKTTAITSEITHLINSHRLKKIFKEFECRISFFTELYKQIKPKKIILLCYYSNLDTFAIVVAANKLGIETVEMQHGPQTDIHLMYGSWSVVPDAGYDLLPRTYWCWDDQSTDTISKWIGNNKKYRVIKSGHPWLNYWKNKLLEFEVENFILYSLQPRPLEFEQLFPNGLIKYIKNKNDKWFIRLHPRQFHRKHEIVKFFKEKGLEEFVEFERATKTPLPLLLANCKIHITHFSGTTLEAAMCNKHTILINKTGVVNYKHLIEMKQASFVDYQDENFHDKLELLIDSNDVY